MRSLPLTLGICLVSGAIGAQPGPRVARARTACAVSYHPLPAALGDLLGPSSPVSLAVISGATFVAFRDRGDALRLARTDDALEPVLPVRELARDVTAFSMTAVPSGVAVAWVESRRALALARVDAGNELENVPQVLAASSSAIERVALARAGDDLAVAWSTEGARVFALRADGRAVPRGGAQGIGEGRVLGLSWLPDARALSLSVEAGGADAWSVSLDERGRELSRARWPAGARGPALIDGASWAVQLSANGAPTLTRATATLTAEVPPPGVRLDGVLTREGVAVAVVSDAHSGRATLTRLDLAGGGFLPATLREVPAGPEALTLDPEGGALAVLRDGRRVVVARVRCAR